MNKSIVNNAYNKDTARRLRTHGGSTLGYLEFNSKFS